MHALRMQYVTIMMCCTVPPVPYRSLALYTEILSSACVTYYLSVVIHKPSVSVYKSARACVAVNGEQRGDSELNILE